MRTRTTIWLGAFLGTTLLAALLIFALPKKTAVTENLDLPTLTLVPETISAECKAKNARLYDPCVDQKALFDKAMALAQYENKALLVSYGADWCIWCHVFEKYVNGGSKKFTYTYGEPGEPGKWTSTLREDTNTAEAEEILALTIFVRENFVILHLESDEGINSDDVMQSTGALEYYEGWLPFVFSVNTEGKAVATLDYEAVQIRRDTVVNWYRGYDREKLLSHLKDLHAAAQTK